MTSPFADRRTLIIAFQGWTDAASVASETARTLGDALGLSPMDEFDIDEITDYQVARPLVARGDDGDLHLHWPRLEWFAAADEVASSGIEGAARIEMLRGVEPARGWRRFVPDVVDRAAHRGIEAVIFLGALLADAPHTRPIPVRSTSRNLEVRGSVGAERSEYQGPVGITAPLAYAFDDAGIPTLSLWASVPHYLQESPSPKAMLALLTELERVVDLPHDHLALVDEVRTWEKHVASLTGDNDELQEYIRQLEQAWDDEDTAAESAEELAREFEKFLRDDRSAGPSTGPNGPDAP